MNAERLYAIAILVGVCASAAAAGTPQRDPKTVAAFKRTHPCPATGLIQKSCPGWIVDHVIPLSSYGENTVANMQWQTEMDAAAKDKLEKRAYLLRVKDEKVRECKP